MPTENEPSRPPPEKKPAAHRSRRPFAIRSIEPVKPAHCSPSGDFWHLRPAAPAWATNTDPSGATSRPRGLLSPVASTRTPDPAPAASCVAARKLATAAIAAAASMLRLVILFFP